MRIPGYPTGHHSTQLMVVTTDTHFLVQKYICVCCITENTRFPYALSGTQCHGPLNVIQLPESQYHSLITLDKVTMVVYQEISTPLSPPPFWPNPLENKGGQSHPQNDNCSYYVFGGLGGEAPQKILLF